MTTPYTMKDIMRFRKAAYLAARVSGEENFELTQFCGEPKPFITAHLNGAIFGDLAKYFEPYLKGLTIETMEDIYMNFYNEMKERRKKRGYFPRYERGKERLRPLSKEAYAHFAKYIWEKRGKPFEKQATGGIRWVSGEGTAHWPNPGSKLFKKYVTLRVSINVRGKKFLKLSIEG